MKNKKRQWCGCYLTIRERATPPLVSPFREGGKRVANAAAMHRLRRPRLITHPMRFLVWLTITVMAALASSAWALAQLSSLTGPTALDLLITTSVAFLMWGICLLPTATVIHSRLGVRMRAGMLYDMRLLAWRLHDRLGGTIGEPLPAPTSTDPSATVGTIAAGLEAGPPRTSVSPAGTIEGPITIPRDLRERFPDSLLFNGDVPPLESDGDFMRETWAIGAFLDVVMMGFTGVKIDDSPIATARQEELSIGVVIGAAVVGTKIPARLRSRIEQCQFLVTAAILKHYGRLSADQVREMLTVRGHDPRAVWGAAGAYLSGYFACWSWANAGQMSPRALRLPPLPSRDAPLLPPDLILPASPPD